MPGEAQSTILIVEDNAVSMRLTADLLGLNGYAVLQAATGTQALELLAVQIPDLILLDIGLPDMTGFDIFHWVKAEKRLARTKIVAFSASVDEGDRLKIRTLGFDAAIPKPFSIREFSAKIKDLLSAP